jgi:hypothetical protein
MDLWVDNTVAAPGVAGAILGEVVAWVNATLIPVKQFVRRWQSPDALFFDVI